MKCNLRSFRDSDGDGIGDLPGVVESLPYLRDLGVDAVWLSPIHPSPDADLGYDVTDYVSVDPRFGSLADFDALVRGAHAAGIAVILDWVGNHDVSRVATRLGDELARAAAVILMTLRGTLTLYYGDELGLPDHPSPPHPPRDALGRIDPARSRDPQRAPMPWNGSPGAGSSTGVPWLPLHPDAAQRSVAAQQADPLSMLALHRRLLALRREHPGLATGDLSRLRAEDGTLSYERPGHAIVARLSDTPALVELPGAGRVVISSTSPSRRTVARALELAPREALVVELG